MIRLVVVLVVALASGASAQGTPTGQGIGAVLRTLDRVSGAVVDVEIGGGQTMAYGTLAVTMRECRYPLKNPAGDAFANIEVAETRQQKQLFSGWMVASSPALMALDHARYDIWVLRCISRTSQ